MRSLPPIHPGEQLREEFMKPRAMTPEQLAADLGVAPARIAEIVEERRGVTGEMALRLAKYFGTSAKFWLDMQRDFELEKAAAALGDRLEQEITIDGSNYTGVERRSRPRLG